MEIAIVTSLVFTILFYLLLRYVSIKQKQDKTEIKLLINKYHLKLSAKKQKRVMFVSNIYYALLFFIAALCSYYIKGIFLMMIIDLIIFIVGLFIWNIILIIYVKRATKK